MKKRQLGGKTIILSILNLLLSYVIIFSQTTTNVNSVNELNIGSAQNWLVWLDKEALWKNDTLYVPQEVDTELIGINTPTCGWENIYSKGVSSQLPVCVEEIFSDGNPEWSYHGVSWFTTKINVPKNWKNKVIRFSVEKHSTRIEIYINERLAGYDIIANTPYSCDISKYIKAGTENRIALRITNPGGQRGWNDFPLVKWGKYNFPPQHDFGGIGGDVKLLVSDKIFIEDIFIKNLLPSKANTVEVRTEISNTTTSIVKSKLTVSIQSKHDGKILFTENYPVVLNNQEKTTFTKIIKVPTATMWSVENPELYSCNISIESDNYKNTKHQLFGFRVFEVKANNNNEENYYLNGERFRHSSAIDWGYYAHHGFYPSDTMAKKSIENAKAIGHNGINFHRNMADPLLLDYADKLGLVVIEEPGGFDEVIKFYNEVGDTSIKTFAGRVMIERCLRMVKRDRNHPSVIGYILANERDIFDLLRKNTMLDMHALDDSKLIVNQSGGVPGGPAGQIPHLRPYHKKFRLDYMDDHTVGSSSRFLEEEFGTHQSANDRAKNGVFGRIDPQQHDNIIYWGEVRCYTGPDNWYNLKQQANKLPNNRSGYNFSTSTILASKIENYFIQNNLPQTGSKNILSPSDVTLQAGRGLMYTNGRLDQIIMSNNSMDGFAINGWSGGSSKLPAEHSKMMEWYSAIVDEGRNLKGPAEDYKYWNQPLQVAIFRKNGKYFNPNDVMQFGVFLINEGKLEKGDYKFNLKVKDGSGSFTHFSRDTIINVKGGDTFAQKIMESLSIKVSKEWKAGYLTIEGTVSKNGKLLASGTEQVLLKNRASYSKDFSAMSVEVYKWPAAKKALNEAGISTNSEDSQLIKKSVLIVGDLPDNENLESILKKTYKGATCLIKFDEIWAEKLHDLKLLKTPVDQWDGEQTSYWNGNGWGYIDHFISNQAVPAKSTIGTNSWEVSDNPRGFYPFESNYPQKAYGAWFARPDKLLVLIGEISYGNGKILLLPSYHVDAENAFNDLLFFNLIKSRDEN